MNEEDYKCDGECPVIRNLAVPFFAYGTCCSNCVKGRLDYYKQHPETKEFWSEDQGFHNKIGCRLPRNLMPIECKEYDCRKRIYYLRLEWQGNGGFVAGKQDILKDQDGPTHQLWQQLCAKISENLENRKK